MHGILCTLSRGTPESFNAQACFGNVPSFSVCCGTEYCFCIIETDEWPEFTSHAWPDSLIGIS